MERFPACCLCQRDAHITENGCNLLDSTLPASSGGIVYMLMSGANLRRRIVFTSMEKFDGSSFRPLTAAEVKQIAGRAGRFGSSYGRGGITCMHQVMGVSCTVCIIYQ